MPKPTGPQFTTLYRGLQDVSHPDEIDPELIGPHWTHTKEKAEYFAGESGSTVTAQVPNEHIMYSSKTGYQHPDFLGNYSFGVKEHIIFPEVNFDKVDKIRGLDITIVTTSNTKEATIELLKEFNFPLTTNNKKN